MWFLHHRELLEKLPSELNASLKPGDLASFCLLFFRCCSRFFSFPTSAVKNLSQYPAMYKRWGHQNGKEEIALFFHSCTQLGLLFNFAYPEPRERGQERIKMMACFTPDPCDVKAGSGGRVMSLFVRHPNSVD